MIKQLATGLTALMLLAPMPGRAADVLVEEIVLVPGCTPGARFEAEQGGKWWNATVRTGAARISGKCAISWDGYQENQNEWVEAKRLRTRTPTKASPATLQQISNKPSVPASPLCVQGATLMGESKPGEWYKVTVKDGPDPRGLCPVQYDGYDVTWDEALPPARITARQTAPSPALATAELAAAGPRDRMDDILASPNRSAGDVITLRTMAPENFWNAYRYASNYTLVFGQNNDDVIMRMICQQEPESALCKRVTAEWWEGFRENDRRLAARNKTLDAQAQAFREAQPKQLMPDMSYMYRPAGVLGRPSGPSVSSGPTAAASEVEIRRNMAREACAANRNNC